MVADLTVIPASLPRASNECVYAIPHNLSTTQYLRLWTAFINSGVHPKTFLTMIGYPNPDNKALQRRLHYDLREHLDAQPPTSQVPLILLDTARASPETLAPATFNLTLEQILDPSNQWIPNTFATPAMAASAATALVVDPNLNPSEQIVLWRNRQAFDDWHTAQLLKEKVKERIASFTPDTPMSEMRAASASMVECQKTQRIALGMPSDNVGFAVAGQDSAGNDLPTITVVEAEIVSEVVDNGGD